MLIGRGTWGKMEQLIFSIASNNNIKKVIRIFYESKIRSFSLRKYYQIVISEF